ERIVELQKIIDDLNKETCINKQIINTNLENINIINGEPNDYPKFINLIKKYYSSDTTQENEVINPVFIKYKKKFIKCNELTQQSTLGDVNKIFGSGYVCS